MIAIVQNIVVLLVVISMLPFCRSILTRVLDLINKGTEFVKDVVINSVDAVMQICGASVTARYKVGVMISSFISLFVLALIAVVLF